MFVTTGLLSKDVKTPTSSLGEYLRATFPNMRELQREYQAKSGKLVLKGNGPSTARTVGAGMDLAYRLMLSPGYVPEQLYCLFPHNEKYQAAVVSLCNAVAFSTNAHAEFRAQAIWALGYVVNCFRAGPAHSAPLIKMVQDEKFDPLWLFFLAEPPAIREITSLWNLGKKRLAPKLEGPYHFGPTFDLSTPGNHQRIAAEADLVANGCLIEIKTTLGAAIADGSRPDTLKPDNIYQILAYALLDHSNAYEISKLGLYSSRYGTLHQWQLEHVTTTMSGGTFDMDDARERIWRLMQEEQQFI